MSTKVLVVDDEKLIVKGIKFSLEQDGMLVDVAYDGEEALKLAKANNYDFVLLDVMLPKIDGLQVCRQIREFSQVPILMVTAKDDDLDKIMGFENGADDYLTKPFNVIELKARIKAIQRRSIRRVTTEIPKITNLKIRGLLIDLDSRRVFLDGEEANLTAKEFDLLKLFMNNIEKVYSREQLLKETWGNDYIGDVRTVDVHIRRLREKIEKDASNPDYIKTKWGVGYYFN